ncbi:uncharacterized protein TNCV_1966881 [Trichonephila clavipes]|nr:uncharacterized protein TNCV_1966881 [Trichonephila clavipes]
MRCILFSQEQRIHRLAESNESEHDFAAFKTTDNVIVGDETENNSANLQTVVVENKYINPLEEPELMENADPDAPKKPASGFDLKPLLNITQCINSKPNSQTSASKNGVIKCSACDEEYCDPPTEEWNQCCKCQEWWHEECSIYENGIFICDYC